MGVAVVNGGLLFVLGMPVRRSRRRPAKVYWEGTSQRTGQGNDIYTRRERAEADPAWVSYLVALP